jgi:CheY-specific phosphatase CheX
MLEDLRPQVIAVVSKVFETMFYIFVEPHEVSEDTREDPPPKVEEKMKTPPTQWIKSEMEFKGKTSGKILLWLPQSLAQTMAVNFLGSKENEVTDSHIRDVTGEVTNMIMGNLFSALAKRSSYVFSLPQTRFLSGSILSGRGPQAACTIDFDAEGHVFQMQVQMES